MTINKSYKFVNFVLKRQWLAKPNAMYEFAANFTYEPKYITDKHSVRRALRQGSVGGV